MPKSKSKPGKGKKKCALPSCRKAFKPLKKSQRFCSPAHKNAAAQARWRKAHPELYRKRQKQLRKEAKRKRLNQFNAADRKVQSNG